LDSDSINFCAFNERAARATNVSSETNVNRERILNMLLENSVSIADTRTESNSELPTYDQKLFD